MTTTTDNFLLLGTEFDLDQLSDIATHGMAQGVAGFIYSSELADCYDENEEEILNYLDEWAFDLGEGNAMKMVIASIERNGQEFETMQQIKEHAVWMFLELMAAQLCQRNGHPDWV